MLVCIQTHPMKLSLRHFKIYKTITHAGYPSAMGLPRGKPLKATHTHTALKLSQRFEVKQACR